MKTINYLILKVKEKKEYLAFLSYTIQIFTGRNLRFSIVWPLTKTKTNEHLIIFIY